MTNIFIGNLDSNASEEQLRILFAAYGAVESVTIVKDRDTSEPRGFAFVEMSTDEEAQKAIADLNGHQLGGRSLTVNEARPKPAYAGGGFGGGDSRRRSEPRW